MWPRLVIACALVTVVAGCHRVAGAPGPIQTPGAPSAVSAAAPERPWKAQLQWIVTNVNWAGQPGTAKSRFDGRCSADSDYVIFARFEGEATHAGRFTGQGSHCSQITWTPAGPGAVTYSDGMGTLTSANGDTLELHWGDGVSGFDTAANEFWFKDHFTFVGGTGLFAGATGGGEEGGRFKDFTAVLAGTPAPMTMEGTITYGPGNR